MAERAKKLSSKEQLAGIFAMAIRAERRAQKMYQEALQRCGDDVMRGILEGLWEDEVRHEKEITALHEELRGFLDVVDGKKPAARKRPVSGGRGKKSSP